MAGMDVGPSNSFMSKMRGTLGSMNFGQPQQKGNFGDTASGVAMGLLNRRRARMGAGNQQPTNTGEMPPPVSGPMMTGMVRGPSFGFNPGMRTMPVNTGGMFPGKPFLGGGAGDMSDPINTGAMGPMIQPQMSMADNGGNRLWNAYQGLSQQSDNPNRQLFY